MQAALSLPVTMRPGGCFFSPRGDCTRSRLLHSKTHVCIVLCMAVVDSSARQTQLLKGVLDVCLLAVISERPAYGYEMTKRLAERGLSAVGEGSIYPVLGRLERDALVETFRQASNGGPPRKYYRLTENGRRSLQRWSDEWRAARSAVDRVLDDTDTGVIA
jgi:PadR family transcriptional regulator, regulatory protein PadR